MRITPKNLLQQLEPEKILFIPKKNDGKSICNVHRALIASGNIPLRGAFSMLPGLLSTILSLRAMNEHKTPITLIIDDDNLSAESLSELRQLCEDKNYCSMPIDAQVKLVLHSNIEPSRVYALLGERMREWIPEQPPAQEMAIGF